MLGPLCVATSVFLVEDAAANDENDLWERLDDIVCRGPRGRDVGSRSRTASDSRARQAKPPAAPRAASVVPRRPDPMREGRPADDATFFDAIGRASKRTAPWCGSSTDLPVAHDADALASCPRLDRGLAAADVRLLGLHAEAVDAGDFVGSRVGHGQGRDQPGRGDPTGGEDPRAARPRLRDPGSSCDRQGGRALPEWLQDCRMPRSGSSASPPG